MGAYPGLMVIWFPAIIGESRLPAFCVFVALAVSGYRQVNSVAALVSFVTMVLSVITGERINFLIRACGGMLAGLIWPKIYSILLSCAGRNIGCSGSIYSVTNNWNPFY